MAVSAPHSSSRLERQHVTAEPRLRGQYERAWCLLLLPLSKGAGREPHGAERRKSDVVPMTRQERERFLAPHDCNSSPIDVCPRRMVSCRAPWQAPGGRSRSGLSYRPATSTPCLSTRARSRGYRAAWSQRRTRTRPGATWSAVMSTDGLALHALALAHAPKVVAAIDRAVKAAEGIKKK
jgi:hypothetical protein